MTKTPEQEVDELVEMFLQTIWETGNTVSKPMVIDVAILHVERLIEVLVRLRGDDLVDDELAHYEQVLSILKDKK